jgi:hypothetical protein
MDVDSFLLEDEAKRSVVPAARGDGQPTTASGGKLVVTDFRTVFATKHDFETIPHWRIAELSIEQDAHNRQSTRKLALPVAIPSVVALGYWGVIHGFDTGTWLGLLLPLVAAISFIAAMLLARHRESYYETLTLRTPDEALTFSASERDAFEVATKVIARTWDEY